MTDTRKIPTHEITYARLRDMILFGLLEPGAPVTIQGLINDLGAGMTPVREALRRLAAEGALLPQGNRRVTVPRVNLALLDQIAFARLTIEPHLAELAAAHLTPTLIARLEALDAQVDAAIRAGDAWIGAQVGAQVGAELAPVPNGAVLLAVCRGKVGIRSNQMNMFCCCCFVVVFSFQAAFNLNAGKR